MNFDLAFDLLIGNEGGYVNDPNDPGGETNWGISKRSYPDVDIRNLTKEGAKAIYKRDFWEKGHMDEFNGDLSFQAFDFAVNSGVVEALKALQRAAGVEDDGVIGPQSLAAINAIKPAVMIMLFIAERLVFWTHCSAWHSEGAGWTRRAANDLRIAAKDLK